MFLFWEDVSFLLWRCGRCVLDVLALPCSTHLLTLDMLRIFEKDIEYRYTDLYRDILLQVRHFAAVFTVHVYRSKDHGKMLCCQACCMPVIFVTVEEVSEL